MITFTQKENKNIWSNALEILIVKNNLPKETNHYDNYMLKECIQIWTLDLLLIIMTRMNVCEFLYPLLWWHEESFTTRIT